MRVHVIPMGLRGLVMLAFAIAFGLAVVDGGSVVLTKITVPDDVRAAGHAAAAAAADKPATRQTAVAAYQAAQDDAKLHGLTVETKDFTLYPDGRVTLTAGKTAPTILIHQIPMLWDLTSVTTTATVKPLPYN